jgi:hypothetical protein
MDVKDEIRKALKGKEPMTIDQLIKAIESFNQWDIKEAVWELTAASEAEITWDWKLKEKA